jgi:hypothetical protein
LDELTIKILVELNIPGCHSPCFEVERFKGLRVYDLSGRVVMVPGEASGRR